MRAIAGPAMLLVIVVAFTGYKLMHKATEPSRKFTDLELASPSPGEPGSCYALGTVLVANGLFGQTPRTWKSAGDDAWTLNIERVIQDYNGPKRDYYTWTFEKHGNEVRMSKVEASAGHPQTVDKSLEELLAAPNARHSTPVERCTDPAATGYLFKRK